MINEKLIHSLYNKDEQRVIEQWIKQAPIKADHDNLTNANLVAEIVLSNVKGDLPQWAAFYEGGHAKWGRELKLKLVEKRDEILDPIFLLMINWADSGPGFSWPESYYATYLPGYDIYIVTASQDSDDMHGFTDEAIDYFKVDDPSWILEPSKTIVKYWWSWSYKKWYQYPWVEVFSPGEISLQEAHELSNKVWGKDFKY